MEMMNGLLAFDPDKRLTAARALSEPYLTTARPFAKPVDMMPTFPSLHGSSVSGGGGREGRGGGGLLQQQQQHFQQQQQQQQLSALKKRKQQQQQRAGGRR